LARVIKPPYWGPFKCIQADKKKANQFSVFFEIGTGYASAARTRLLAKLKRHWFVKA
jgi:hypothetical protein